MLYRGFFPGRDSSGRAPGVGGTVEEGGACRGHSSWMLMEPNLLSRLRSLPDAGESGIAFVLLRRFDSDFEKMSESCKSWLVDGYVKPRSGETKDTQYLLTQWPCSVVFLDVSFVF